MAIGYFILTKNDPLVIYRGRSRSAGGFVTFNLHTYQAVGEKIPHPSSNFSG